MIILNPEVFYSIGDYDEDSRFYQFDNPESKSWYDFEMPADNDNLIKFCFCRGNAGKLAVPLGYWVGRKPQEAIKALIFTKDQESPVLIES